MSKTVTTKQIQDLDRFAIEEIGIPSLVLMENAGRKVASEILKVLRHKHNALVCVLCGTGNNGGDGLVIARHLLSRDIKVKVYLIGKVNALKPDALANYRILRELGHRVEIISRMDQKFANDLSRAEIVVDGIFGVGLNRDIVEPMAKIINTVNDNSRYVVSIDIPSGLDGTTGRIYKVCVKADMTVTFTFAKKGFYIHDGPKYTGKVRVVDIGIPNAC